MYSRITCAEVCDARDDDSSRNADYQNITPGILTARTNITTNDLRACKLGIYLLYLRSDPYFMQIILRKLNLNLDGIYAGSAKVSSADFHKNISRFCAAELFHLIFPGFQKRINSLISLLLFQYKLFKKNFRQLKFAALNVPNTSCKKNKLSQLQSLIR